MVVRTCSLLVRVRSEAGNSNGIPYVPPNHNSFFPRLTMTKPSLIVRTESNVRREVKKKPEPPCVSCKGSGKVDCSECEGEGRTNCINSAMLPRGEWPRWCKTCGGSGLKYCNRCLGTGERRLVIGFHDMSEDDSRVDKYRNRGPRSAADLFVNPELLNPESLNTDHK